MVDVELAIGGHRYRVGCEPGEEARLRELADRIETEIAAVREDSPALGEARQLLFAALRLADRCAEAEAAGAGAPSETDADDRARDADAIDRLAQRMESLADGLEKLAGAS